MLELSALSKNFGGLKVLEGIDLVVPRGGIHGLIGPNGAGKTTLFNIITGLYAPSAGSVSFEGKSLVGRQPHRITQLGLARTFQNIRVFKEMTLIENVVVGMHRHLRYGAAGLLFATGGYRAEEKRARERALEIAIALISDPEVLLLDEPTAGMGPEETREMVALLEMLARQRTILLVEHKMKMILGLSDRILVLHHGRLIADGSPREIQTHPEVRRVYLGQNDGYA